MPRTKEEVDDETCPECGEDLDDCECEDEDECPDCGELWADCMCEEDEDEE